MERMQTLRAMLSAAALAAPAAALAHPGHAADAGFLAGFAHPLLGLDHLLAMLAVGMWASQYAGRIQWGAPLAFLAALLAGAFLGMAGFATPVMEPLIAASVLVLGLVVALRLRMRMEIIPLMGAFALLHGLAHGSELGAAQTLAWLPGFMLATALLHGLGVLLGRGLQSRALRAGLAGGPIAAAGAFMLLQRLPL